MTTKTNLPICGICKLPIEENPVHRDHIIPKAYGGPSAKWNLRPAHELCNKRRHTRIEPMQLPLEAARRGLKDRQPRPTHPKRHNGGEGDGHTDS